MIAQLALSFAVAALAALPAQTPPPPAQGAPPAPQDSPSLTNLAGLVDAAHRPGGPTPVVTALRGNVELHLVARNAEQRGQVDLGVRYLEWTRPDGKKVVPLLRYEVKEAGTPLVRGRDRNGPWLLAKDEPRDMTAADLAQDLAEFERRQNLVRQLLRFLEPGAVLRSLQQPGPVAAADLVVQRGTTVPCHVVVGNLAAFPLLRRGGDDAPALVKVWIERAGNRLLAVDATPVVDGRPDDRGGERVLLKDLRERDGLLVPNEIVHLFAEASGGYALQSRAVVTALELRPELRAEDFDRANR
ncbi:MAG: hypothetical protein ACK5AL_09415 [Planctomycetota bacterium]|jgi:hypothetical protein